jgi:thymidylate synthase ThyX
MTAKVLYKDDFLVTFITTMPRFIHMEFNRHRTPSLTAKSTRFTLAKDLLHREYYIAKLPIYSDELSKIMYLTGDELIDSYARDAVVKLAELLSRGKKNDEVKSAVPECLNITVVYTMTHDEFDAIYTLRSAKTAHPAFRELINIMKDAMDEVVSSDLAFVPVRICGEALATCYGKNVSEYIDEQHIAYIKRIGVDSKHSSVLEHLRFRFKIPTSLSDTFNILLKHNHLINTINGLSTYSVNLRTMYELPDSDVRLALLEQLPEDYKKIIL